MTNEKVYIDNVQTLGPNNWTFEVYFENQGAAPSLAVGDIVTNSGGEFRVLTWNNHPSPFTEGGTATVERVTGASPVADSDFTSTINTPAVIPDPEPQPQEIRNFLDAILLHIGSESLTDAEFATVTISETVYSKETYQVLRDILSAREAVSWQLKKLKLYFLSRGVNLSGSLEYVPRSNIFIGTTLD